MMRKMTRTGRIVTSLGVIAPIAGASLWAEPDDPPLRAVDPTVVVASALDPDEVTPSPSTGDTVSAETARQLDILTARRALNLIPNVGVIEGDSPRASSFSVRGSHEITFHELTGGRSGVGFYLDDIPVMDAYGRDLTLFDVDRISFHKGPHGTSFGVPHSMGVMEVVTRPPGEELRGGFSYRLGNHESHQFLGDVSGPIRPDLFFGLDGRFARDDGWFEDRLTGASYGKHEIASGRARLRWLPTERLEINLTVGLDHHDDDPQVYVASDRTRNRYRTYTSPDAYATGGQNYQALQALWRGDEWQIKSTTSHRDSHFDDYDPVFLQNIFDPGRLPRRRNQDTGTWTQEIRLESTDPEATWRWRTGLFLSTREATLDHHMLGLGPWEGANSLRYRQDDYALYGEGTRVVSSHLELSGGLRLQTMRDHTSSSFDPTPFAAMLGGTPVNQDDRDHFSALLPMAAATWNWSETQRSFLRFSTGMQPGGLAIAGAGTSDYDSEYSFHYEVGHDASFLDDTVKVRAACFYTDYRDYQSFQFNPAGQTIFNANDAHALGVEAELRVRPAPGLELYLGAGYTKARFDDFNSPIGDFSGHHINNIPSGTVNLGAEHRTSWGGVARVDWQWIGDTWFDEGNTVKQDAYGLLNARIGYENERFGVYLFARNLFDEEYYTHTYLFQGLPAATPGTPRIAGVELRATF